MEVERYNQLNPTKKEKQTYVEECFKNQSIPVIASTDYMRSYAEQIRPYIKDDFTVLGTDGFGRSDSRSSLREFFEIDANSIVRASAYTLFKNGTLDKKKLKEIYDDLEVDPLKPNPWEV
jgi:pyruvate dehydrogenase E1 component